MARVAGSNLKICARPAAFSAASDLDLSRLCDEPWVKLSNKTGPSGSVSFSRIAVRGMRFCNELHALEPTLAFAASRTTPEPSSPLSSRALKQPAGEQAQSTAGPEPLSRAQPPSRLLVPVTQFSRSQRWRCFSRRACRGPVLRASPGVPIPRSGSSSH